MGNLKSWQPGNSGNPKGRPKGSRNFKNVIRDLLDDQKTWSLLPNTLPETAGTPIDAVVCALTTKAIEGDVRAADTLLKYAINRDELVDDDGNSFFNTQELVIKVVNAKGEIVQYDDTLKVTDTGQLIGYED